MAEAPGSTPTTPPQGVTTSPFSADSVLHRFVEAPTLASSEPVVFDTGTVGSAAVGFLFGLREASPWVPLALLVAWQLMADETRGIALSLLVPSPPSRRRSLLNAAIDVSVGMASWYGARVWQDYEQAQGRPSQMPVGTLPQGVSNMPDASGLDAARATTPATGVDPWRDR